MNPVWMNAQDALASRRIGTRQPVVGERLRLYADRPSFFGRKRVELDVDVENASVTGVGVLAPRSLELPVGRGVVVEIAGVKGRARVAGVRPTEDPDVLSFGLQFLDQNPQFLPEVLRWLETAEQDPA